MKENKFYTVEELQELVAQVANGKLEMPKFRSMEEAEKFSLLLCCEIEKNKKTAHTIPFFKNFEECKNYCLIGTNYDFMDRQELMECFIHLHRRKPSPGEIRSLENTQMRRYEQSVQDAEERAEKMYEAQLKTMLKIASLQKELYNIVNAKKQTEGQSLPAMTFTPENVYKTLEEYKKAKAERQQNSKPSESEHQKPQTNQKPCNKGMTPEERRKKDIEFWWKCIEQKANGGWFL